MAAGITDYFTQATNGTRPVPTTLTALKAVGASSISCGALTGWPTATAVHFVIYTIDTSGAKVAGSQTDWKGIVSGTTITNLTLKAGTDNGYGVGAVVEAAPTAAWATDVATGLAAQHNQDGTHSAVTASSVVTTGAVTAGNGLTVSAGTVSLPNNAIAAANLATSAITLGYASITANFSTAATSATAVTGLSTTVTVPAGGRRVKITAFTAGISQSAASTNATLMIYDGTPGTGTLISEQVLYITATAGYYPATVLSVQAPAAGSKTYTVAVSAGSGTVTVNANASFPAFILVEAI